MTSVIAWICKVTGVRDTIFDYEKSGLFVLWAKQSDSYVRWGPLTWFTLCFTTEGVLCFLCIHSKPRIKVLCDILVNCHTVKHVSFHKCVFFINSLKFCFVFLFLTWASKYFTWYTEIRLSGYSEIIHFLNVKYISKIKKKEENVTIIV